MSPQGALAANFNFEQEYNKQQSRAEKLNLLRFAGLRHPYYLGKYILEYDKFEDIHYEMLSFVLAAIYNKVPECLDLEPRGCFKTSAISVTLPIFLELKNPDINMLINHKVKGTSTAILDEIQDHYKINKLFVQLYGNRVGKIWRQGYITSKHRTKPSKEPTIAAGSVDKELVAGHYDIVVDDDIVTLKDYLSKKERDKTKIFYHSVKYLAEDGTMVNVGTRWDEDDLYGTDIIPMLPKEWQRIKPIVENGKYYFPNKYPKEVVDRLKGGGFLEESEATSQNRIMAILFDAVMMQKPRSDKGSKPFKELKTIKQDDVDVYMKSMAYFDPAFSQNQNACYSAVTCLGMDNKNQKVVKDIMYRKVDPDTFVDELLPGFIRSNDIGILVYESNSAQVLLDKRLRDMVTAHGLNCIVIGIPSTANKHLRIMAAQPTIVSDVYFLEEKMNDAFGDYALAVTEIKNYNKEAEYKDATDSLAGAVSYFTNGEVGAI